MRNKIRNVSDVLSVENPTVFMEKSAVEDVETTGPPWFHGLVRLFVLCEMCREAGGLCG